MKKKRVQPSELVSQSVARPYKRFTWHEALGREDKTFVRNVVDEIRKQPGAALYLVAESMISELSLTVSKSTVARTLKGMLNAKS